MRSRLFTHKGRKDIPICEIIACELVRHAGSTFEQQFAFDVHTFERKENTWRPHNFRFFSSDHEACQQWVAAINELISRGLHDF